MSEQRNFQKPPPRKRNALDEYKLRLSCPPVQGGTRPGSMAVSLVKNQPHIDVYTNVPNDKDNGNIRAAMDLGTFMLLLELLDAVVTLEPNQVFKVQNLAHTFFERKRSEFPKLNSTTVVGRDKDGVAFIAVVAKDRPYLKFNFLPTNYHAVFGLNGEAMSPAEVSTFFMKGWIRGFRGLMTSVAVSEYVEPPPRDPPAGGNGAGNGGGGNDSWKNKNSGGGNGGGNDSWKNKGNNDNGGGGSGNKSSGTWGDGGDDEFPM